MQNALQGTMQAALETTLQEALPGALTAALTELYIMTAQVSTHFFDIIWSSSPSQNHNLEMGDGTSAPFKEVWFPNGDCPTQLPACYSQGISII